MKTIDTKLDTLKDIIDPLLINASPQKKRYAKDLFLDIITDLNFAELKFKNLESKVNGFEKVDGYMTDYQKSLDVLILMGASDIPYEQLKFHNMRWICENNDKQTQPFTFQQLFSVDRMLTIFLGIEERMPVSTDELKEYFKKDE